MKITYKWASLLLFNCLFTWTTNSWAYPVESTLHNVTWSSVPAEGSLLSAVYTGIGSATSVDDGMSDGTTFRLFERGYRDFAKTEGVAEEGAVILVEGYPGQRGNGVGVIDMSLPEGACTRTGLTHEESCSSFNPPADLNAVALEGVSVPEPDIIVLMGLGLAGIALARMSRKQHQRGGDISG